MRQILRSWLIIGLSAVFALWPAAASAAETAILKDGRVDVKALLQAGGAIGYVIIGLSLAMVALILEHLMSIRRGSLMPRQLAEDAHQLIQAGQYQQAEMLCRQRPSFLGHVVASGLSEVGFGYSSVEKSMEDASLEQAARLFRKIEYLSVIGTIAPMLGLMGTVWGMIQAFGEFAESAVPQPADFAPAISHALVTTLMGLTVAIPAFAAFALFRNRIDEFVAETSLLAEHVVNPLKRSLLAKSKASRAAASLPPSSAARAPVPPVALEREPRT